MLVGELESLDKSESLLDISTNSVIVDLDRSNLLVLVQDEHAPKGSSSHGVAFLFHEDSIVSGHFLGNISQKRVVDLAEATIFPLGLQPG